MTDVSMAVEQDAVAESLLGEPEQTETVEQTGAEETEQVESGEQTQQVEEQETQSEEAAEDWLPTDQDKVFTDDVLLQYAQRYQKDAQWLSDPLNRQLLTDKLNTDIYLRQQQQEQEQFQQQESEPEQEAEPTREQVPQITREQHFQNLERVIQERTDPEVAKAFHAEFLRAFGVPEAEIAKAPAEQALKVTQTVSKYMLNLVNTFMGDMLQSQLSQQLSQTFPGFGEMYERSAYAMAWDRVRNSNQQYSALPAYGSKEFTQTMRTAAERIPGFDEMQFTDAKGKPLPMLENSMRKYSMLAQMASGQNVDPKLLQQAANTVATNSRRADVRRAAGNLGSGQSKAASGSTGSSRFQTNNDLFDEQTMDIYKREHGRL